MALTNAERQKLYRQKRKEQVSELDLLRNKITDFENQMALKDLGFDNLSRANYSYADKNRELAAELEKLRNENELLRTENEKLRTLRKKTPKLIEHLTQDTAIFYCEGGELKLLQWPETIGVLNARKIQTAPYSKIDKKFIKDMDKLILQYNNQADINNQSFLDAP